MDGDGEDNDELACVQREVYTRRWLIIAMWWRNKQEVDFRKRASKSNAYRSGRLSTFEEQEKEDDDDGDEGVVERW